MIKKFGFNTLANRLPLLFLVIAFILPIFIAWVLVQSPENLRDGSLLNKGSLLQPPLNINLDSGLRGLQVVKLQPSGWSAILFSDSGCESECERAIANLMVIRDLLGHAGGRFKVIGLFDAVTKILGGDTVIDEDALKSLSSLLASRLSMDSVRNGIVFLDWRGQIVNYFRLDANPSDIQKDLKRLLRASKIK